MTPSTRDILLKDVSKHVENIINQLGDQDKKQEFRQEFVRVRYSVSKLVKLQKAIETYNQSCNQSCNQEPSKENPDLKSVTYKQAFNNELLTMCPQVISTIENINSFIIDEESIPVQGYQKEFYQAQVPQGVPVVEGKVPNLSKGKKPSKSELEKAKKESQEAKTQCLRSRMKAILRELKLLRNGRHFLVKGYVQSGKTKYMIASALAYFSIGVSSIIVVRDSIGDKDQLSERIEQVQDSLNETLKEYNRPLTDIVKIKEDFKSCNFKDSFNGMNPKIFVLLGNNTQVTALLNELKKLDSAYYTLFIDEADEVETSEASLKSLCLNELKEHAIETYHVSATILEIGLGRQIDNGNVILLDTPQGYRGLETVTHCPISSSSKPCNNTKDDPFEKVPDLNNFLLKYKDQEPYHASLGDFAHPHNTLINIGIAVEPQQKVFSRAGDYGITVILYNGNGTTLYSKFLASQTVTIKYKNNTKSETGQKVSWMKGAHHFAKLHVSHVLQWLKENGGAHKFPNIINISGKRAGRGMSFTSLDYGKYLSAWQSGIPPGFTSWRTTGMIYVTSDNTSQPNLMQCAGRLCCVIFDNLPTIIYTPLETYEDIRKAYWTQEELLARARKQQANSGFTLKVAMLGIKMAKAKLCLAKRSLTQEALKAIPVANKVRDDSGEEGAFDMAETYNALPEMSRMEKEEIRTTMGRDDVSQQSTDEEFIVRNFTGIVRIVPEQLPNGLFSLYDRTLEYITSNYGTGGQWIPRKEIVDIFCREDTTNSTEAERKKNPMRGRFSEIVEHAVQVDNEMTQGMLVKKQGREIYFKVN